MIAALVNLLCTFLAQPYVRIVRNITALMSLDIVYCVIVLFASGGWVGPFGFHALSCLVLPALNYGWRGGLMSGLLFVSLHLSLNFGSGRTPAFLVETGYNAELVVMMAMPPVFGVSLPSIIEILRRFMAYRAQLRLRRQTPSPQADFDHDAETNDIGVIGARQRGHEQRDTSDAALLLPSRTTAVRAAEQGVEELRRNIFAPFPSPEMDLPSILNVLATRFSTHTGAVSRVTLLGRARALHYAQRDVLIRLSQEALLNIQQHAHAERIELTLRYDAHSIALLIQDNGVGLLDGTYERPGLHALRAMHYRLSELGGRLDVFETEGGGVTVRATAPLD